MLCVVCACNRVVSFIIVAAGVVVHLTHFAPKKSDGVPTPPCRRQALETSVWTFLFSYMVETKGALLVPLDLPNACLVATVICVVSRLLKVNVMLFRLFTVGNSTRCPRNTPKMPLSMQHGGGNNPTKIGCVAHNSIPRAHSLPTNPHFLRFSHMSRS